jgi:hypothetical protein
MFDVVNHLFDILFYCFREMYKVGHTVIMKFSTPVFQISAFRNGL